MSVGSCRLIGLPTIPDESGDLTFIEAQRQIPFEIRRIYYVQGVPEGGRRGGHAHKELHQIIVAIHGSFEVAVDDGDSTASFHLDRADQGLYVGPMTWRTLNHFSPGAICLVITSEYFDEHDYLRDYDSFRVAARAIREHNR